MSIPVSRNSRRERPSTPAPVEAGPNVKDWGVLLRAVSTTVHGGQVLYLAASLLTKGRNPGERGYNTAVLHMTAQLLDLPDVQPDMIERVLRHLPESEM